MKGLLESAKRLADVAELDDGLLDGNRLGVSRKRLQMESQDVAQFIEKLCPCGDPLRDIGDSRRGTDRTE